MNFKKIVVLSVFCLFAFSTVVVAQEQSPFSMKELNRFIGDYPEFISLMREKGEDIEALNQPDAYKSQEMMRLYKEFADKKGWDLMRFGYMMSHVGSGYAVVRMEEQQPQIQQQMEQAKQAIMSNPGWTDEMKQQMLAQMQQGMMQTQAVSEQNQIPDSEMSMIRQNKDKLLQMYEQMQ